MNNLQVNQKQIEFIKEIFYQLDTDEISKKITPETQTDLDETIKILDKVEKSMGSESKFEIDTVIAEAERHQKECGFVLGTLFALGITGKLE